ncbi:unnamed protein product [Musa banksii]
MCLHVHASHLGVPFEWERRRDGERMRKKKGGSNLSITKAVALLWGEDRKEDGRSGVCRVVSVHSLNLDLRWTIDDAIETTVSAYGHHRQGPNSTTHHAVGRLLTLSEDKLHQLGWVLVSQ